MQLEELDLKSNQISGTLPGAWGNLTSVSPSRKLDVASACIRWCQALLYQQVCCMEC